MFERLQAQHGITLTALPDAAAWQALDNSPEMSIRRHFENAVLRLPFPCKVPAVCGCCNHSVAVEFSARHAVIQPDGALAVACSESGVCPACRINSRMRFACDLLRTWLGDRPAGTIYLTERKTHLFAALSSWAGHLMGSEYLGPEKTSGQDYDGVMHQDVQALSFDDALFDAVVCLDVIEHIDNPEQAIVELHRVLRPGGLGIVTMPFFPRRAETVVRARLGPGGACQHLLPPEFHGNPLGGGALVFRELAWDFIAALRVRLGGEVRFVHYSSLLRAHFGPHRFAILLTKNATPGGISSSGPRSLHG